MKTVIITVVILFWGFSGLIWAQEDPLKGPWDNHEFASFQSLKKKVPTNPGIFLVSLYQQYISPIDGSDCPMYPSDSRYAVECFQKHGFLMGWVMTVDRLYRCGRDELRQSQTVKVNGQSRCYDPVQNNDFWWSHGQH
jgi:putative component of membrane protein insertase Oxa1/YidC/SpoIIIJ protein YidD